MKKIVLSASILLLLSYVAVAHSGKHGKVLSKKDIILSSKNILLKAIDKKVIPNSWKTAALFSAEIINQNSRQSEWHIIFENSHIDTVSEKYLHVFLDLDGTYLAMNYTGN